MKRLGTKSGLFEGMKDTITASPEVLYKFLTTVYGESTAIRIFKLHGMPIPAGLSRSEDKPLAA